MEGGTGTGVARVDRVGWASDDVGVNERANGAMEGMAIDPSRIPYLGANIDPYGPETHRLALRTVFPGHDGCFYGRKYHEALLVDGHRVDGAVDVRTIFDSPDRFIRTRVEDGPNGIGGHVGSPDSVVWGWQEDRQRSVTVHYLRVPAEGRKPPQSERGRFALWTAVGMICPKTPGLLSSPGLSTEKVSSPVWAVPIHLGIPYEIKLPWVLFRRPHHFVEQLLETGDVYLSHDVAWPKRKRGERAADLTRACYMLELPGTWRYLIHRLEQLRADSSSSDVLSVLAALRASVGEEDDPDTPMGGCERFAGLVIDASRVVRGEDPPEDTDLPEWRTSTEYRKRIVPRQYTLEELHTLELWGREMAERIPLTIAASSTGR